MADPGNRRRRSIAVVVIIAVLFLLGRVMLRGRRLAPRTPPPASVPDAPADRPAPDPPRHGAAEHRAATVAAVLFEITLAPTRRE